MVTELTIKKALEQDIKPEYIKAMIQELWERYRPETECSCITRRGTKKKHYCVDCGKPTCLDCSYGDKCIECSKLF